MRLVTYFNGGENRLGAWADGRIVDLARVCPDMLTFISMGSEGITQAKQLLKSSPTSFSAEEAGLQAPIPKPIRNIMCLGLNYIEHAQESYAADGKQVELPEAPIVFTKATTAVNGPFDPIPFDPYASEKLDWEVELAFVIGKRGKNIPVSEAMEYVFGYTVLNDVSARDLQKKGKQFFKGKSLDGCCPFGPWIITADEIPNPGSLRITSRVNGLTKQDSSTSLMIFDVPSIVSYLSTGMTLLPGDIIATGTPSGVGFARIPPEFLKPGDVVECEVEGIGLIRNEVMALDG